MKKRSLCKKALAGVLCVGLLLPVGVYSASAANIGYEDNEGTITNPNEKPDPTPTPTPNPGGGGGGSIIDKEYPPIIVDRPGGSVEVTPSNPSKGDKVTIHPIPDKGYEVDKVEVLDKDGKPVKVTDNGDGTYSFIQPKGSVQISVTFKKIECDGGKDCPSAPYTDLSTGAWYHNATDYVIANGLMTGTGTSTFSPDMTTTRAMIVSIFYRLEGGPSVNYDMTFDDVAEGDWYAEAVRWGASEGVVNGYSAEEFGPNDPITREQMAAMLSKYAAYKGIDVSDRADLSVYTDEGSISDWAYEVLSWANAEGMITGMTETTLVPQGNATRAQVAAILMRFCQAYDIIK